MERVKNSSIFYKIELGCLVVMLLLSIANRLFIPDDRNPALAIFGLVFMHLDVWTGLLFYAPIALLTIPFDLVIAGAYKKTLKGGLSSYFLVFIILTNIAKLASIIFVFFIKRDMGKSKYSV
ncbi:hypothetical protein BLNAU_4258 [Blattamonas nauphoetae]|uniref:Integral membrane protein n=1 Tax=Blattamonas nauphoetae TaxID=2049346 RepID=A0ABQ9YB17_9EUKA|nr:hypothetical protein BLNAU_4258 [Blattamonas nauphoetae]